jgi:PilZ domain-containing protein
MRPPVNTRRWQRYPADLPLGILICGGRSQTLVHGFGTEISQGGMSLYAKIPLQPGDLTEIELQKPRQARISAIVRNRTGYFYGLEFINQLPD